jgi:hypothetical protein
MQQLGWHLTNGALSRLSDDAFLLTLGIPLDLQDYCLEVATLVDERHVFLTEEVLAKVAAKIAGKLEAVSLVALKEALGDPRAGRRRQLVYCCAFLRQTSFTAEDIVQSMRINFDSLMTAARVSTYLDALVSETKLLSVAKAGHYQWRHPKILMQARLKLKKAGPPGDPSVSFVE